MDRRTFLRAVAATPALSLWHPFQAAGELPRARITRVRIFRPPNLNRLFNQSTMICTVETDIGITGIGEGGSKDTLEQCAGTLIGKNPFRIEAIWQEMYIAWFYPPGREKVHALGALDMALWDIKGKAFKAPVHELLGGTVRDHLECYGTAGFPGGGGGRNAQGRPAAAAGGAPPQRMALRDRARATMEAGYRAFRMGAGDTAVGSVFNTHERVRKVLADCKEAREGVGTDGDWCIDLHQRF